MLADWARDARALLARGPAALVTILAVAGSAPRGAGTRMLVGLRETRGTIGGGVLEHDAIAAAHAMLAAEPGGWAVRDYVLGAGNRACRGTPGCEACGCAGPASATASATGEIALAQCCGGRARVLLEHLDPAASQWLDAMTPGRTLVLELGAHAALHAAADYAPEALSARGALPAAGSVLRLPVGTPPHPLYLFGAGHVGRAIAHAVHGLPFALHWFDSRPGEAADAGATHADEAALEAMLADVPRHAAVLILTHDHALDYRLTQAALARRIGFVGLIGSASKRARFLGRLRRDRLDDAALARLTGPIGLPGIGG